MSMVNEMTVETPMLYDIHILKHLAGKHAHVLLDCELLSSSK